VRDNERLQRLFKEFRAVSFAFGVDEDVVTRRFAFCVRKCEPSEHSIAGFRNIAVVVFGLDEKNSQGTLGYASFFHMSTSEDLRTRAESVADEFRAALSEAVARSIDRMRIIHQAEIEINAELNLVRAACRAAD